MTFDDFATAVAGIAGSNASSATQDARRYTTGSSERRWTAWVQLREGSPGVLVDGSTPEQALQKLRAGLEARPSIPATNAEAEGPSP